MGKFLHTLTSGYLHRGVFLLALLLTTVTVNVFMAHTASAGGAIMIGSSVILEGKDRETGHTYVYPPSGIQRDLYVMSKRLLPVPSVVKVYQGDWVRFMGVSLNVDPFPIPGLVQNDLHYKGFNDPVYPINIFQYAGKNVIMSSGIIPTFGTGVAVVPGISNFAYQSPPVQMVGPGSDIPGKQYCQFISTVPTFYLGFIPVIPYVDWKFSDFIDLGGLANLDALNDPSVIDNPANAKFAQGMRDFLSSFKFGRTMSCAEIAYNYSLTPIIGISGTNNVALSVQNNPEVAGTNQTYTKPSNWQVTQFVVRDINTPEVRNFLNGVTESQRTPCTYLSSKIASSNMSGCTDVAKSNGMNTIFDRNGTISSTIDSRNRGTPFPTTLPAPPPGANVCYMLSVNKYRPYGPSPNWRNSKIVCKAGGTKKPKIQVYGDDVRVGRSIATSQTDIDSLSKMFGSWGQYASYSVASVTGFGTSSGLKGGQPTGALPLSFSKLTFANTPAPFGNFANSVNSRGLTGVKDFFKPLARSGAAGTPSTNLASLASSKTPYLVDNTSGTLEIEGGTIGKGKTIIIVATGDVKIKSDITYTNDQLSSVADIPQVVIVARNIAIDEGVGNIDAWLIADARTGVINTCASHAPPLTIHDCKDRQLKVNGPVVTNKLLLYRTYGSEGSDPNTLEEPAEIFRNRGDAYLWAAHYLSNDQNLVTSYQIELPPRY